MEFSDSNEEGMGVGCLYRGAWPGRPRGATGPPVARGGRGDRPPVAPVGGGHRSPEREAIGPPFIFFSVMDLVANLKKKNYI